jgi:hypothetical protein
MARKFTQRGNSIHVYINEQMRERVWQLLEEIDSSGADPSRELLSLALKGKEREEQESEWRKDYPDEYITDTELKIRARELPVSWSILPNIDVKKEVMLVCAEIQFERDMSNPEWLEMLKEVSRLRDLEIRLRELEEKKSKMEGYPYKTREPIVSEIFKIKLEIEKLQSKLKNYPSDSVFGFMPEHGADSVDQEVPTL